MLELTFIQALQTAGALLQRGSEADLPEAKAKLIEAAEALDELLADKDADLMMMDAGQMVQAQASLFLLASGLGATESSPAFGRMIRAAFETGEPSDEGVEEDGA